MAVLDAGKLSCSHLKCDNFLNDIEKNKYIFVELFQPSPVEKKHPDQDRLEQQEISGSQVSLMYAERLQAAQQALQEFMEGYREGIAEIKTEKVDLIGQVIKYLPKEQEKIQPGTTPNQQGEIIEIEEEIKQYDENEDEDDEDQLRGGDQLISLNIIYVVVNSKT
eukprot:TRINITY_DN17084_c0_g1_i7.p2 TRINITY_DN17084_c0_g1~~TRINITY_DN17084_c0_g1_i7.p2  ORF type:complete len:165 (+),score=28.93 TRINITY_DN17084_c0_g1_i7:166-660(+)